MNDEVKVTPLDHGLRAGFIVGAFVAIATSPGLGLGVVLCFAFTIAGGAVGLSLSSEDEEPLPKLSLAEQHIYDLFRQAIALDKEVKRCTSEIKRHTLNIKIDALLKQIGMDIVTLENRLKLKKYKIVSSKKEERQWVDRVFSLYAKDNMAEVDSEVEDSPLPVKSFTPPSKGFFLRREVIEKQLKTKSFPPEKPHTRRR